MKNKRWLVSTAVASPEVSEWSGVRESLLDGRGDENGVVVHEEVARVEQRLEIEELREAEVRVLLALRAAQEAAPRRLPARRTLRRRRRCRRALRSRARHRLFRLHRRLACSEAKGSCTTVHVQYLCFLQNAGNIH